jgi:uncharacterized protein (TIGR02118 family)
MTQKAMFVIWQKAAAPSAEVELRESKKAELVALGARSLVASFVRLPEAARAVARPDGSQVSALVSATFPDQTAARRALDVLSAGAAFSAGYAVSEAIVLDYDRRDWPEGAPTPGIKQVTLLRRKSGLDYADFLRSWHEVHTPLAMRVHPLWAYNRNVVEQKFDSDAPDYDGIVELMFRSVEDLTEPARFFGSQEGMQSIMKDVVTWLDLERIEYYPMQEFVLSAS